MNVYRPVSRQLSILSTIFRRQLASSSDPLVEPESPKFEVSGPDFGEVSELRSAPAKGLAALKVNEGGNINRADLIGTITEMKVCSW